MPYIDRDELGRVVGMYSGPQFEGQEFVESAELYEPPPSPLQQIRAMEDAVENDLRRMQRQMMIAQLLERAMALAPSLTKEQVHAHLMSQANASGKGYAKLVLLEQAIEPLRELL